MVFRRVEQAQVEWITSTVLPAAIRCSEIDSPTRIRIRDIACLCVQAMTAHKPLDSHSLQTMVLSTLSSSTRDIFVRRDGHSVSITSWYSELCTDILYTCPKNHSALFPFENLWDRSSLPQHTTVVQGLQRGFSSSEDNGQSPGGLISSFPVTLAQLFY